LNKLVYKVDAVLKFITYVILGAALAAASAIVGVCLGMLVYG